jgi:hypothetical protein
MAFDEFAFRLHAPRARRSVGAYLRSMYVIRSDIMELKPGHLIACDLIQQGQSEVKFDKDCSFLTMQYSLYGLLSLGEKGL